MWTKVATPIAALGLWAVAPTPPPPSPPVPSSSPASPTPCARVRAEPRRCMALVRGGETYVATIGLDSGLACLGPATDIGRVDNASMGWLGDRLYVCADERVVEIDIASGKTRAVASACEAVTSMDTELLVRLKRTIALHELRPFLARYASFDDLRASRSAGRRIALEVGSIIAARDGVGYYARGSGDKIYMQPFGPYAHDAPVLLERFDGTMHGLDVAHDGTLVIATRDNTDELRLFDAATGDARKTVPVALPRGLEIAALKCN